MSGNVYYGDQGYVWLETIDPIRLDEGFEGGLVEMNGATSKVRLIIDASPRYMVELWTGASWSGSQCFDAEWESVECSP